MHLQVALCYSMNSLQPGLPWSDGKSVVSGVRLVRKETQVLFCVITNFGQATATLSASEANPATLEQD